MIQALSLNDLALENTWVTIGIFDGVHLGHRALLKRLVEGAHAVESLAVVLTFHPHPAVVLGGKVDFKTLTSPAERVDLFEHLGVDIVITQTFDAHFADQPAEAFMRRLVQTLGLQHLVIGYDTALGRGREGDAARLEEELGHSLGYTVEVVKPLLAGDAIISSGGIRKLIHEGAVEEAAALLGRPYAVSGLVVHGDGRGRHINLPTANLDYLPGKLIPANGIYATWVSWARQRVRGATNIGTNPTFTPGRASATIETHLLDFDHDLYGEEIKLEFVSRLRDEVKYPSVEALLTQIRLDIEHTREILK